MPGNEPGSAAGAGPVSGGSDAPQARQVRQPARARPRPPTLRGRCRGARMQDPGRLPRHAGERAASSQAQPPRAGPDEEVIHEDPPHRTAAALSSAAILSVTGAALATPATAAPVITGGVVDVTVVDLVDLTNTSVSVPITVAAQICCVSEQAHGRQWPGRLLRSERHHHHHRHPAQPHGPSAGRPAPCLPAEPCLLCAARFRTHERRGELRGSPRHVLVGPLPAHSLSR
ncbi:MAG: hypothetical protein JWN57_2941 [Frankiales bacterium]|nr:hypothetical protein [Frankiales bacterium]